MTNSERIKKIEEIQSFLSGIELALGVVNSDGWPSLNIQSAIGSIGKAKRELDKELSQLRK